MENAAKCAQRLEQKEGRERERERDAVGVLLRSPEKV